jgi:hypothetical protein
VAERRDEPDRGVAALLLVGLAVGADHPLVDPPGGFDLDVGITGEQGDEAVFLLVGEQALTGVQGAARTVERILGVAAVAVQALLDPTAALVESVAGEGHDMEGVHHRGRVGELLGGRGLEPGEPVHRDDLHPVTPVLVSLGGPRLERCLGPALDHVR